MIADLPDGGRASRILVDCGPGSFTGIRVGIAAAPDFTARMREELPAEAREAIARGGAWRRPSAYGDPYPVTRALLGDGERHLLLRGGGPIPLSAPVRLLHGQRDPDVPWELSLRVAEALASEDVQVALVKDGDHRLSRPRDLALLRRTLAALLAEDGG